MGAVKRFAEEVSCVLGDGGELTPFVLLVSDKAILALKEYGLDREQCVSENETFIEFIRVMESQVRSECIRDEGVAGAKIPID